MSTATGHRSTPRSPHRSPTRPGPWEPPRPLGTRWTRITDSVRLLASVAGMATGTRGPRR